MEYIEELLEQFRETAESYSAHRAALTYLEEFKKSLLAIEMKHAQADLKIITTSGQEREALASDRYLKHLDQLKMATELEAKHKFALRKIEMEIEVWRTKQANDRLEKKTYGA